MPHESLLIHSGPRSVEIAQEAGGMALLPTAWPASVKWPVAGADVVVIEHGEADDDRIELLVLALLRDGATSVRVWRLALIGKAYRHVWLAQPSLKVAA